MVIELSSEQEAVLADILSTKDNIFVTGKAGAGKSTLLKALRQKTRWPVCASTGVAAANIGGVTLHSFLAIGTGEKSAETIISTMYSRKPWFTPVLIIDEISMISAELLDKLSTIAKAVRSSDLPFGGMRIVAFGDMLQLPPVQGSFAFKSEFWKSVRTVKLCQVYRQKDEEFLEVLNELRQGKLSDSSRKLVESEKVQVLKQDPLLDTRIKLRSTNAEIDAINLYGLERINTPVTTFKSTDTGKTELLKDLLIPDILNLKVGARVMLLANVSEELFNGKTGVVTGLGNNFVLVLFDGTSRPVRIEQITRNIEKLDAVVASRTQIPLRLAYAITIHKSQGMTFEAAEIDTSRCFAAGQVYVAISRLSTLSKSVIVGLGSARIFADSDALAFENGTRAIDHTANVNATPVSSKSVTAWQVALN